MAPGLLVRVEDLVRDLEDLHPPWKGLSLPHYARVFDESGVLRPIYRVQFPERYAHYLAQRDRLEPKVAVDKAETPTFEQWDDILSNLRAQSGDPEAPSRFQQPVVGPVVIRPGTQDERVDWNLWERVVSEHQSRPITRPFVFSFYGAWQRLRFWALLEAYTFRGLLDPRKLHPSAVFDPEWDRDLRGRVMTWTVGTPRILRLVEMLEEDDWLRLLYLSREVVDWAELRVQEPRFARWAAGDAMTSEERARTETERVTLACRRLGAAWMDNREAFRARCRHMLELWARVTEVSGHAFNQAIKQDLWAIVRWAAFMYGEEFVAFDEAVGPVPFDGLTLGAVLQPTWTAARRTAEQRLPYFLETLAREVSIAGVAPTDTGPFLDFLRDNELSAWHLEFSALLDEIGRPSDASWDRRFLHVRSLCNLAEPVLVALADRHGTAADQERMKRGSVIEPLKAFLADRRQDWRARLWQIVAENWDLTSTLAVSLEDRLDAIAALALDPSLDVLAKTILAFGAVRNFGSHRFTRDPGLLRRYEAQLLRGAVWTPFLYWKIATTLR